MEWGWRIMVALYTNSSTLGVERVGKGKPLRRGDPVLYSITFT